MSPSSKRRRAASSTAAQPPVRSEPSQDEVVDDDDEELDIVAADRFRRLNKLAPAAGLVYALLAFVGGTLMAIGDIEPEQPAADVARHFADHRGRISAGILLTMFSLFFLLVFVAWLHRWLRDAEGPGGWLGTLAVIGGSLLAAMMSVVVLLSIAGTVLEGYGDDPVIARTFLVLQWQAAAIAFVPTAVFIGATSLVGLASELLPKSLTYSGLAIALGLLLPPIAFFPFLLSTLWVGMLAILLLQRTRFYGR